MEPTRSIRETLSQKGFDPIEKIISLVNNVNIQRDLYHGGYKRKIRSRLSAFKLDETPLPDNGEDSEETTDPGHILAGLELDKIELKALSLLNDARQREDDQRIKLMEHELRKNELEERREERQSKSAPSGSTIVYSIPAYGKELIDGKYKLVKLDGKETQREVTGTEAIQESA